ncbi:hypothetical protein CTI14_72025, partial [Methylobacterium radiotolerans]
GTLRVAVYGDNAPFSEEAAGKPRGIDAISPARSPRRGTLRVAVYGDNAPFSEEAAGKPRGIDAISPARS